MTKRQLIDEITAINRSAEPAFLARFDEHELVHYLEHLRSARGPRLRGDASRYAKYFEPAPHRWADKVRPRAVPLTVAASLQPAVAAPLFH